MGKQLSDKTGTKVTFDVSSDRMRIHGSERACRDARRMLEECVTFYFGDMSITEVSLAAPKAKPRSLAAEPVDKQLAAAELPDAAEAQKGAEKRRKLAEEEKDKT